MYRDFIDDPNCEVDEAEVSQEDLDMLDNPEDC